MMKHRRAQRWWALPWAALMTAVALQATALELEFTVEDTLGALGQGSASAVALSEVTTAYSLALTGTQDAGYAGLGLQFIATNLSALPQTFRLRATRPVAGAPVAAQAALSAGLVGAEGGEATGSILTAAPGEPIVRGLADDLEVAALFGEGYALACPVGVSAPCTTAASDTTGAKTVPGPSAPTSLGVTYVFRLMPGDSGAGSGLLRLSGVTPLPEPSIGLLWGIGLAMLAALGRKGAAREQGTR